MVRNPETFQIGSADPIVGIVRIDRPAVLYGKLLNTGDVAFTLRCQQSSDNGVGDAFADYNITILEGGTGAAATVSIVPGGVVSFIVSRDVARESYVKFDVTTGAATAQGSLEITSALAVDRKLRTGTP